VPVYDDSLPGGQAEGVEASVPIACGTNSGYQKHIRDGTPPCVPCRMAHTENARKYNGCAPYTPATPKPCSVEDCDDIGIALGMCEKHYRKNRKYGHPLVSVYSPAPADGLCTVLGCGRGGKLTKGFCAKHYQKWRKYGDPLGGDEYTPPPADGLCTVEDCFDRHFSSGWCRMHYMRMWVNGDMNYHYRENPPDVFYLVTGPEGLKFGITNSNRRGGFKRINEHALDGYTKIVRHRMGLPAEVVSGLEDRLKYGGELLNASYTPSRPPSREYWGIEALALVMRIVDEVLGP
jgi:hypothetical protein